ncbi:MAG: hypothetical protein JSS02_04350 [Planctomycetes bacterium]|nr:hypothetical protein [Planctomycetota bacterium]
MSRLAAHYAKCRRCPHAPGASGLAIDARLEGDLPVNSLGERGVLTAEGIRGRYLNELNRADAAGLAGAFASCLWEESGLATPVGNSGPGESGGGSFGPADVDAGICSVHEGIRLLPTARPGPSVVIAHDERPAAPDIVTGVGQALRRMGCQVIDIGLAPRPALMFAIHHLQAAGAVHVTGAGCDPGWIGLDFVHRAGLPCSNPGWLDHIAHRQQSGFSRPSRRPGLHRTFLASVPYQASLVKHFHALRPLKIVLACSSRAVLDLFQSAFRKLACRLICREIPTRVRDLTENIDSEVVRMSSVVREATADLGLLVADDGEQCLLFDETGARVSPVKVARLLVDVLKMDGTEPAVLVMPADWKNPFTSGRVLPVAEPNREQITRLMAENQALVGTDGRGRYWSGEAYPVCDALLTLVHLLHFLSRSDTPFSEVTV